MAPTNPAINPPVLAPSQRRTHSRSSSKSPARNSRDFDPLLRDLSPTTALRVFNASDVDQKDGALEHNLGSATASERALGAKAARTCLDLRSWVRELESWEWPGTFEAPEPVRKRARISEMSFASLHSIPSADHGSEDLDGEYWGSLPGRTVLGHQQRLYEINRGLDGLELDDLKLFVLAAHRKAGTGWVHRSDSIGTIGAYTDLQKLDDFTALITATILQTLPYLSRLHRLLDIWGVRLAILRQIPAFLHDLAQARTDLDHGWAAIALTSDSGERPHAGHFTREIMDEMKVLIQQQVGNLGRRLDGFLDDLEGRPETVPDTWIEELEALEMTYGEWAVLAERKVQQNEWRMAKEDGHRGISAPPAINPGNAATASDEPTIDPSLSQLYPSSDPDLLDESSVTPESGAFDFGWSSPQTEPNVSSWVGDTAKESSEMLPESGDVHSQRLGDVSRSTSVRSRSSAKRARHVPIVIDYENPDRIQPIHVDEENSPELILTPPPENVSASSTTATSVVEKRAAFLNMGIERTDSLQKQHKSPVRPFEHASNAFTRLFRREREKTPEQTRSNSLLSNSSRHSSISRRSKGRDLTPPIGEVNPRDSGSKQHTDSSTRDTTVECEAVLRRQHSSHRSLTRTASKTPSAEKPRSRRSVSHRDRPRDYVDMPGGFRPRSRSEEGDRRLRQRSGDGLQEQPHKIVETYKPRRLASPFRPPSSRAHEEPEWPADWPLSSPASPEAVSPVKEYPFSTVFASGVFSEAQDAGQGPDLESPHAPMESDTFDRVFVESFPTSPDAEFERNTPTSHRRSPSPSSSTKRREKSYNIPILDDSMLDTTGHEPVHEMRVDPEVEVEAIETSIYQLDFTDSDVQAQPEIETPASVVTDISEAELKSATSIDYFHVRPPSQVISRASSSSAAPKVDSPNLQRNGSKSSASAMTLKLQIPGSAKAEVEDEPDHKEVSPRKLLQRASIASIELHPRGSVRSIDMRPRSMYASSITPSPKTFEPWSPTKANATETTTDAVPPRVSDIAHFPTTPGMAGSSLPDSPVSPLAEQSSSATPPISRPFSARKTTVEDSPVSARSDAGSIGPLNAAMAKRQDKKSELLTTSSSPTTSVKANGDVFDRHVSEVLDRLPSHAIRFKPKPGRETPVGRTSEPRTYAGPRPKPVPRAPSRQTLTLAPADNSPTKSATDEVKVYHLTQTGRDEPIKLFVRLVGEGERVMVRVGGGWADLADYLRQYADHHASRTASGGAIELMKVEGTQSRKVSNASTPLASSSTAKGAKLPVTPVATTPRMEDRASWSNELQPASTIGGGESERTSPLTTAIATQRSTPGSRPSTAGSATAAGTTRPGSQQGWTDSGPGGRANGQGKKQLDLPEQKARWVEGMLEKAKAASAEKGKEERTKYFGDMGKANGTRRVIFRQSSAQRPLNSKMSENADP